MFRPRNGITIRHVNGNPSNRRRTWIFWGKCLFRLVILALVSWGIWRTVDQARGTFSAQQFRLSDIRWSWLAGAGVAYVLGMLPCCVFWQRTLRSLGQKPRFRDTLRAFYIGHLGKYVPGKALVVVIRTALIRSERVDTAVAAASVFIETLTMMAVGAAVATVLLAVQFHEHYSLLILAVFLALAAGTPTLPPVFRRLVSLLQVHRASDQIQSSLKGLNYSLMAFGWVIVTGGWMLFGVSLWCTLKAMPQADPTPADAPMLTACVSLAMVAGFLSLLPGGIGVREYVVMQLVAPRFGIAVAIVSAVLLRLVWLLAELIVAVPLYFGIPGPSTDRESENTAASSSHGKRS